MLRVSIILCFIAGTFAQSLRPGPCRKVNVDPIDFNRMSGLWYEHLTSLDQFDPLQVCLQQLWSQPNNGVTDVLFTSILTTTNQNLTVEAEAYTNEDNALLYDIHVPILGVLRRERQILETDFENYSISRNCTNVGSNHIENIGIFTREQNPRINYANIGRYVFARYGLRAPEMIKIDQQCCL
ncbi:uncharacterized protein LOC103574546 [Microplitis demolitor]|uniref:uncharacterized protein LOC103574546 n=1 Tax=Microplitis demolitor TaxID=69319 RepID=UPI0004CD2B36|nr:uncharacterized protein LOC103574546 [Microplitis demolitor]